MEQDMLGVLKFLWSQLTDWRTHVGYVGGIKIPVVAIN